ncbi:TetR/AcrR family transcriptional regulator [Pseudonocardia sp. C8]|uniref:TetR/AcrR family transcriptional regulator n=1 Tax=Pseudonocardia sp. C8 TaxID=2762759 RepID=UPI0016428132|nr:TetR/AcrR family transcriptional regulator [Pseudonocardia sp. C8]MBC3192286.1 TetR/AcrR family transcriptional regulator [Pseudonocardia sp. C8]
MGSLPDDRTARARIRDEALRLFADHGPDAVTVRDIATAAGVSPALVVRHYGSKDGLRDAVDDHVAQVFEVMLDQVSGPPGAGDPFDPAALPGLAEIVADQLPAGSAIPAYLGRMLVAGGPVGSALFERLHQLSRRTLAALADAGLATEGAAPDVRAAFLLVNDLAVLILRARLTDVLGTDPLSAPGMRRWAGEVLAVYGGGLRTPTNPRGDPR